MADRVWVFAELSQGHLQPVSLELVFVAVIVAAAPDWLSVIDLLLRIPALKAALVPPPALIVRFELRSTVPLKPVTVLLNWSCAVTWTRKALPAVWLPIAPPPCASTLK